MCSVVIAVRPGQAWPVLIAANRDEMVHRPWKPPARHWQDRPQIVAGLDEVGGGTWLGVNEDGLVAAVMNRAGSLGPDPERRSRGELALEALDHADAREAANALADLDADAYRPFNMVLADNLSVYWMRSLGRETVEAHQVPAGIHMLTAHDLDDPSSPRIRAYLPRFLAAPLPDPDEDVWDAWELLLASRARAPGEGPEAAMCIVTEGEFATVSSSVIALPGPDLWPRRPIWRFAAGPPDETEFYDLDL